MIGDIISCEQGSGEVVDVIDGKAVVRPFPIPEQRDWTGPTRCFVAHGEITVVKFASEWDNSYAREMKALADRAREREAAFRRQDYERAAEVDRAWYRERDR